MKTAIARWLGLGVLLATTSFASAQELTLRLHHHNPVTTSMHTKFVLPWVEMVRERTQGRVKIEVFPSMMLGGRPQSLADQVKDGVVDIVWTITSYTPGRFPELEAFELPFVHRDVASTNKALAEFQRDFLQERLKDYKVLSLHTHAGNVLLTKDKPVRTADALKGMKIRTPSESGGWFLQVAGANPVGALITEVPQLLSRGLIEGLVVPFEIIDPFKLQELTRNVTELSGGRKFQTTIFMLAMNKARYEKMPPDLRALFDTATGDDLMRLVTKVWEENEQSGIDAAKAAKNTFIMLSPEETDKLVKLAPAVHDRWIAQMKDRGIDGARVLAAAQALIAKHAK